MTLPPAPPTLADKITEAQGMRDAYLDCIKSILINQSYTIAGQSYNRANLTEVQAGLRYWENVLDQLQGNSRRIIKKIDQIEDYHGWYRRFF